MILSSDKIKEKIIKKYNSNPKDWRVIFGKDNYGYHNMAAIHDSELWLIKEEKINPYKFDGYGTKLDLNADLLKKFSPYSFGLRPISEKHIKELAEVRTFNEDFKRILSDTMRTKPVPSNKVNSPIVLQGPVVNSDNSMRLISKKHEELDLKLRNELRKMLHKKYPQTMNPYS